MNRNLLLLLLIASPLFCQTQKPPASSNPNSSLSQTIEWNPVKIAPLRPANNSATFNLATSWIPGEKHKGYFRYRMRVTSSETPLKDSTGYFKLLNSCQFLLVLYDSQDFKLREILLSFNSSIVDTGDVTALSANEMAQMDADDYRAFMKGSFNIMWEDKGACHASI
jgi:hypothetical protein